MELLFWTDQEYTRISCLAIDSNLSNMIFGDGDLVYRQQNQVIMDLEERLIDRWTSALLQHSQFAMRFRGDSVLGVGDQLVLRESQTMYQQYWIPGMRGLQRIFGTKFHTDQDKVGEMSQRSVGWGVFQDKLGTPTYTFLLIDLILRIRGTGYD